ncbi:MAG: Crp/Fnr family transcriptional regulator [Bacteroidetes bacterium]|nr:Crp/Fnr family transcriptional regulator [Bacteroidota bacterium]MBS1974470.1 Crp/Fnr family transcriptional regulator [Bacteroidota bacterium]
MGIEEKMILIRNYDLWSNLSDEEYHALKVEDGFKEVPKDQYIYFEAYNHNKIYFAKQGYIKIGFIDEEGNERVKEIIQPGDFFGQFTLERDNLQGEFAKAYKNNISLCSFAVEDFEKLLTHRPDMALKYSKWVGFKLRKIQNRLINLLNKDVKKRLENFLWQLVEQNNANGKQAMVCVPNYLTHEDIASLIGSSRQTVTTFLNELEAEKLIRYNRHQICFPDVKELQKRAAVA